MTELHQLDTSALSKLARPEHELVRKCLLREIDAGRIIVLATHPLLWEIPGARAVDPAHYRAMFDLLMQITDRRVLLTLPERAAREIRAGGALARADIVDGDKWIVPIGSDEEIDHAAAVQAGHAAGLAFYEAERAADAVDGINELAKRQALDQGQPFDPAEWRRALKLKFREEEYVLDLADHYAGKDMRDVCRAEGLEAKTSPLELPSLRTHALIHVARMRAVIIGGTSPTGKRSANQTDLIHLGEAAPYADVFVAEDRGLRAFAKEVRELGCEVLSFSEWADRLTR